jgi:hypothetical protein
MRVFSLNELNIGRPLFYAQSRHFRRVVAQVSTGEAFRDIFTKSPKWFRRVRELFH